MSGIGEQLFLQVLHSQLSCKESQQRGLISFHPCFCPSTLPSAAVLGCYWFPLPTPRAAVGCDCPKPAVCALHHVHAGVNHGLHGNTEHGSAAAHTLPAAPQSLAGTAVSGVATQVQPARMINTPPDHRHTLLRATRPTGP